MKSAESAGLGRVGREQDLGNAVAGEVGDRDAARQHGRVGRVGVRPAFLARGADDVDPAVVAGEHHLQSGRRRVDVGDGNLVGQPYDVAAEILEARQVGRDVEGRLPTGGAGAIPVDDPQGDAALAVGLRGVLDRADHDDLRLAVAIEIGQRPAASW